MYSEAHNLMMISDSFLFCNLLILFKKKLLHRFHKQVFEDYMKFLSKWMLSHIEDGDNVLNKPVLFSEFGLSDSIKNYSMSNREKMYKTILDISHKSAKNNRSGAGAMVWQFLVGGMSDFIDDFGMVPWEKPSIYSMFTQHSCRLSKVNKGLSQQNPSFKQVC
jgi:mannan endo-1,4-beta-mannosidase